MKRVSFAFVWAVFQPVNADPAAAIRAAVMAAPAAIHAGLFD
jgi:hypothetical protein